jgi:hypothetical protein
MEKHILELEASGDLHEDIEDKALELAIEETYQKNGQKWRPWAKNGRSIRMGEVILIVDSDTIVPEVPSILSKTYVPLLTIMARTVSVMQPASLLSALKLPLSNTNQTSCKSPTTTSKMVLRILPGGSTNVYLWVVLTVKSRPSLVTTLFCDGKLFKRSHSLTLMMVSRRFGLNPMSLRTSIWHFDFS